MSEIKDTLGKINEILDIAEDIVEGIAMETIQNETEREKWVKIIAQSLKELWNNFKLPHICRIRILVEKEKGRGHQKYLKN